MNLRQGTAKGLDLTNPSRNQRAKEQSQKSNEHNKTTKNSRKKQQGDRAKRQMSKETEQATARGQSKGTARTSNPELTQEANYLDFCKIQGKTPRPPATSNPTNPEDSHRTQSSTHEKFTTRDQQIQMSMKQSKQISNRRHRSKGANPDKKAKEQTEQTAKNTDRDLQNSRPHRSKPATSNFKTSKIRLNPRLELQIEMNLQTAENTDEDAVRGETVAENKGSADVLYCAGVSGDGGGRSVSGDGGGLAGVDGFRCESR